MDRLGLAADKLECAEVVYRVARAIDRCDKAMLLSQFHPDATDDHGLFSGSAAGFADWVIPVLATMHRTQHLIGQVLVEVAGDRAAGESYFIAHHALPGPDGELFSIAAGRYLDRFERREQVWKIAHRQAVYDWGSAAPSSDTFDRANPGPMTFGARGVADPTYAHFEVPQSALPTAMEG